MRSILGFFWLLALVAAVYAQNNSSSSSGPQLTTSLSVFQGLDSNRQTRTLTSTFVLTVAPATPSTNASSNSTNPTGGNSTSTTVTPSNLPTAATSGVALGGGPAGAPAPGATGGAYGPDDGYIAAGSTLRVNFGLLIVPLVMLWML